MNKKERREEWIYLSGQREFQDVFGELSSAEKKRLKELDNEFGVRENYPRLHPFGRDWI